jgi:hypothetical protein
MEILSIRNNELTNKLGNIGSTQGASLVEITKIIKKGASTSCLDVIDDSNPYNQVLVKNVIIETCSDVSERKFSGWVAECTRPKS